MTGAPPVRHPPSPSTGAGPLIVLGTIWGATFPIARVGVEAGADPVLLVAVDLLLATAAMAVIAATTRAPRPGWRSAAESAALGALLIGGINLTLFWGLRTATGGTASIVYASSPLLSLVVLVLMRATTGVGPRQVGALLLGLAGVGVLGYATTAGSLAAGLAGLVAFVIGAACQGTGAVLVGRARPSGEGPWGLTFEFAGGAVAAAVLLPVLASSFALPIDAATIGSIAYVGFVSVVLGYTLFFALIRRFGAVRANQVTFLNPVVALLIGVFVFGESFQPVEALALAFIVLALLLLQPRNRQEAASPAPPAPELVRPGGTD
jgi:probable blue pigment (indigoidine) exporter